MRSAARQWPQVAVLSACLWHASLGIGVAQDVGADDEEAELSYEERRTGRLLRQMGHSEASEAEGRTIAFVRIHRADVFAPDELIPTFFNAFHWRTREPIVRRELLFEEGEAYRQERVSESMRNLRDLGIFSFVRIVPVDAESPDEVGVVVHTRDLWSLRLENSFQITGSQIDHLLLQLTERNLFGRHKRGAVRFIMVPDTFRVGQVFFDRRLFGARLSLFESGDLIFNRSSGELEGGIVAVQLESPFYDLSQRFAFELTGLYSTEIERRLQNGQVVPYDIPETEEEEQIGSVWDERLTRVSLLGRFRVGRGYKQEVGLGFSYEELHVAANEETGLEPAQEMFFARDVLPQERRQVGPLLRYRIFTPSFDRYLNLGTYGQSEDVRSGPNVELRMGFPVRAFGSSTDSAVFEGDFGYVITGPDVLAEASIGASSRLEDGDVVDQVLRLHVRGGTPFVGPVRLVGRLTWEGRRRDTSRSLVSLGGDNGLRGYVSQAFFTTGGNLVRGNLEIRTLPLDIESIHIGGVLFYDVGAVYDRADDVTLHHAVGIGIRFLLPQFNRMPFRADLGFQLDGDSGVVPSFGGVQAVPLTEAEDLLLLE